MSGLDRPKLEISRSQELKERILSVRDRQSEVCQGHHFAFVFELSHVEEVGNVFKEHTW